MDITLLINSCDSYSDVWFPFFRILEKTWPQCRNFNIILNTETKKYTDSFFNIKTFNILQGKSPKIAWGERLLDVLERIESEFIIMMLEDFFLEDLVDNSRILSGINALEENDKIASILFISPIDVREKLIFSNNRISGFVCRTKNVHFVLNTSPGIWRKNTLIKYTKKQDNPWTWEFFGSIRTWFIDDQFYCKAPNEHEIFLYDYLHGGAIHRGKWVGCNVRPLLQKYNIEIDLDRRGVIEDWLVENPDRPKRNILTITYNKWLYLKNIIIAIYLLLKGTY